MNEIIYLKLDDIKPYENNPRHNEEAVDKVYQVQKPLALKAQLS